MNEKIRELVELSTDIRWCTARMVYEDWKMNGRIQELMTKCNIVVDGTCDTSREEKFAKLIVQECASICDELQEVPATEPRHCAEDIRIRFGLDN